MKLIISGGQGDMFMGLDPIKDIGDKDPLQYMLDFVSNRMRTFRQPITYRVWGRVIENYSHWPEARKAYVAEVEYVSREGYIGYVREKYFGTPTTI